jgi:hypothetical protein
MYVHQLEAQVHRVVAQAAMTLGGFSVASPKILLLKLTDAA